VNHLDDLTSALVDGELDHDQRDRALSHITGCDSCRAQVDAERRLKALLANQSDPQVSTDLTARLLAVPRVAGGPDHPDVVRRAARQPRRPAGARPARTRRARTATFSALGVALVAGVAAAGGGSDAPRVRPPVATFVDEHTATTTGRLGPLNDPAGSIVLVSSYGR
jgi:anti-sigma factor RsiW